MAAPLAGVAAEVGKLEKRELSVAALKAAAAAVRAGPVASAAADHRTYHVALARTTRALDAALPDVEPVLASAGVPLDAFDGPAERAGLLAAVGDFLCRAGHTDAASTLTAECSVPQPVVRAAVAAPLLGPSSGGGGSGGGGGGGSGSSGADVPLARLFATIHGAARQIRDGNVAAALASVTAHRRQLAAAGLENLELDLHAIYYCQLLQGRLWLPRVSGSGDSEGGSGHPPPAAAAATTSPRGLTPLVGRDDTYCANPFGLSVPRLRAASSEAGHTTMTAISSCSSAAPPSRPSSTGSVGATSGNGSSSSSGATLHIVGDPTLTVSLARAYAATSFAPFVCVPADAATGAPPPSAVAAAALVKRLMAAAFVAASSALPATAGTAPAACNATTTGRLAASAYADLIAPARLVDAERAFVRAQCRLCDIARESPLEVVVAAGLAAAPAFCAAADTIAALGDLAPPVAPAGAPDGGPPRELGIELALPAPLAFHSVFACPISRTQVTPADNPPMLLPCGHVRCARPSIAPPPTHTGAPPSPPTYGAGPQRRQLVAHDRDAAALQVPHLPCRHAGHAGGGAGNRVGSGYTIEVRTPSCQPTS